LLPIEVLDAAVGLRGLLGGARPETIEM